MGSWLNPGHWWELLKSHLKEWLLDIFTMLREVGIDLIDALLAQVIPMFPQVNWLAVELRLAEINYVFPLAETVALASALAALWALVFTYKLIKSWIPLIGS